MAEKYNKDKIPVLKTPYEGYLAGKTEMIGKMLETIKDFEYDERHRLDMLCFDRDKAVLRLEKAVAEGKPFAEQETLLTELLGLKGKCFAAEERINLLRDIEHKLLEWQNEIYYDETDGGDNDSERGDKPDR